MSSPPDELDSHVDEFIDQISTELSDDLAEKVRDRVLEDLPPELADEIHDSRLEPLTPSEGIDRYIQHRIETIDPAAIDQDKTKLEYVNEYLTEELGLENLNNLTPRQADDYTQWRKYDSLSREKPLSDKTLRDDTYLYINFLEYMWQLRAVSRDVHLAVDPISLDDGDGVDTETLDADRAADILAYLYQFEYVTPDHMAWIILTKIGRRPSGLRAPDCDDYDSDGDPPTLTFEHRPETDTPLKENEAHEAEVELSDATADIIDDYLENTRPDVTDEHGREPLLATEHGRISSSTIKKYAYKWTRPCEIGKDCPFDKDPDTCEAATNAGNAYKCDATHSPADIRSGYVTAKLNSGASYEAVAHRVGATKRTLKKHYDHPKKNEERKRHKGEILDQDEPDASGYANGEDSVNPS